VEPLWRLSHTELCFHEENAAMAVLVAFGGMRGDQFLPSLAHQKN
jgi:hypothetical protein